MKTETFDAALRAVWQAVSKMYNKQAAKFGSTMAIGFALLSIDPEGIPSTSLGPKMGMGSTSLSRLLKTMEEKQLIYRDQNPKDGRSVLVHLTPFGKAKRDDSKFIVLHFNEQIKNLITETQMKHFFEVMNHIKKCTQEFEYFHSVPVHIEKL